MNLETSRGESDQRCNGYFETTAITVKIGEQGKTGFRDLILSEVIKTETSKQRGNNCETSTKTEPGKHYVLHFGDPHYGNLDDKASYKDQSYNDLFNSVLSER